MLHQGRDQGSRQSPRANPRCHGLRPTHRQPLLQEGQPADLEPVRGAQVQVVQPAGGRRRHVQAQGIRPRARTGARHGLDAPRRARQGRGGADGGPVPAGAGGTRAARVRSRRRQTRRRRRQRARDARRGQVQTRGGLRYHTEVSGPRAGRVRAGRGHDASKSRGCL